MRDYTQKNLYELIERSVLGNRRGANARVYLAELGTAFRALWETYRSSTVAVNYATTGYVDAYRLHYLPHYAHTAFQALERLPKRFYEIVTAGECVVGVAAAGPLPEAIALLERCAVAGVLRGRIRLHAYDIAVDAWRGAAMESIALAKQLNPGVEIDFDYHPVDFRDASMREFPAFDHLMFQHCVNEFAADGKLAPGSLQLVRGIVRGGTLLFSDLTLYDGIVATIQSLERALDKAGWLGLARFDPSHAERTPFWKVPNETYFSFYEFAYPEEGALQRVPRFQPRRNLNYSWSMWSRS